MSIADLLVREFTQECANTRKTLERVPAALVRHLQIQQYEVGLTGVKLFDGLLAVSGKGDLVTRVAQQFAERFADAGVVVRQQNARTRGGQKPGGRCWVWRCFRIFKNGSDGRDMILLVDGWRFIQRRDTACGQSQAAGGRAQCI